MGQDKFWYRIWSIFGILGGLVLFIGDMLFYYQSGSSDIKLNMAKATDLRLILSGISALMATWFYLLGLIPVYFAFNKSSKWARNTVIASFVGILTAYGVIHAAYIAIATTSKLAFQHGLDIEVATELASKINNVLRWFVYPIFAILSFFFIKEVWEKKTLYPRWIILFFPLLLFMFNGLVGKLVTRNIKLIIMGGYFNILLIVFFTASAIALWNIKKETKIT